MKALVAVAALLAGAAPALAQENQIIFESPKGTTDPDRLKAAKALAARCVAHGWKDVTGDTARPSPDSVRQVRLLSAKGFTKEMYPAIDFLSSFPCRRVELRFERLLTEKEKETYQAGGLSPKGSAWVKHQVWESAASPFPLYRPAKEEKENLFLDKPVIDAEGKWKIHRHEGGDLFGYDRERGVFLTFKGAIVKTIHGSIVPNPEKPGTTMLPINLFIDGLQLSTENGSMGWRVLQGKGEIPDLAIWTFPELTEKSPLVWLMENPLPFELKRVKP